MKTLARLIERELQSGKWKHCAVYEHELMRVWHLGELEREAKIAQRTGEIRVLDSSGNLERTIAFDDANRKL